MDKSHGEAAAKQFKSGEKVPVVYTDFRKLMERDDVHIIITGTPDHWHTMVNLLAVRTGKDVYSEKPLTLCIDEGKRLVKAVRENKRILQVGSQQRSDRNFRLACELVRNGRIGKLQHMIVGLPTGPNDGPFQTLPIPESLNWDFYLGQAPKMDYVGEVEIKKGADGAETKNYKARCAHWDFRWWYCFSGGQMTDWGAHHDDIAQWGNGTERSGPVEIDGKSLSAMKPGGFTAAATYRIDMKYANGVTLTIVDEQHGDGSQRGRRARRTRPTASSSSVRTAGSSSRAVPSKPAGRNCWRRPCRRIGRSSSTKAATTWVISLKACGAAKTRFATWKSATAPSPWRIWASSPSA